MFKKMLSLATAVMAVAMFLGVQSASHAETTTTVRVNANFGAEAPELSAYINRVSDGKTIHQYFRVSGANWSFLGDLSACTMSKTSTGAKHACLQGDVIIDDKPTHIVVDLTQTGVKTGTMAVKLSSNGVSAFATDGELPLLSGYLVIP